MTSKREIVLEDKKSKVTKLVEKMSQADAVFFTEYRGLTVNQMEELRNTLREVNGT